ncbi:hypothetical protein [Clostridium rectalis]|uniref:hypothetical protein n=1 Tax=Clostridium rectalis TaxID=2040295 RepID=UPI0013DDE362|nr:hypothetical protein [Clostridium rectalis]
MEKKNVKSVFLGRKVRKYWSLYESEYSKPSLVENTETLERVKVLEKEMDFEFEVNEEIYLEELEKYTKIQKKTRDTNGNIIYNITYVAETIEDYDVDIKNKYNELLEEWNIKFEENEKEYKKECEKRKQQEKESNEKYNKFFHEKEKVKKDKIIIFEIPRNKDGKLLMNQNDAISLCELIEMKLPMNYNVITSPFKVALCNSEDVVINKNINKLNNIK